MPLSCPQCASQADPADNFCRHCGYALSLGQSSPRVPWYYQPGVIILLGLFILGPFVLPLIWKSPALSRPVKIWLSAGIILYTAALIYGTWLLASLMLEHVREVMRQMESL